MRVTKASTYHQDKVEVYGQWLDTLAEWDFFATWTTREPWTAKAWRRAISRYLSDVRASSYFWGLESHRSGYLHAHGLIKDDSGQLTSRFLWKTSFDRFGRSKIILFDPGKGATKYVSKYCFKAHHSDVFDWDFKVGKFPITPVPRGLTV